MQESPITNMNAYNAYYGNNLPQQIQNSNSNSSSVAIIAVVGLIAIAFMGGYALSNHRNIKSQLK